MRRRHIWHGGRWVDVTEWKRAPHVGPYIIRDGMDALLHPATGEMMDSKSAFRAVTKAAGLIEVGDQAPMTRTRHEMPSAKEAVIEAKQMLEQGYTPPPLERLSEAMPGEIRTYPT